jgi:hypothetical protein
VLRMSHVIVVGDLRSCPILEPLKLKDRVVPQIHKDLHAAPQAEDAFVRAQGCQRVDSDVAAAWALDPNFSIVVLSGHLLARIVSRDPEARQRTRRH